MSIQQQIVTRLDSGIPVLHLDVINESHMHNVPEGSESHFNVTVVSSAFEAMRKVKRHQTVYGLVADLLAGPVHALALHTYTPAEWEKVVAAPASPPCLGG